MNEETKLEPMTMERESMTKMGYERPMEYGRVMRRMGTNMNLGREKLPWSQEIWDRIDQAVHAECQRTKIARKIIPLNGPVSPGEVTVPSDTIVRDGETLAVDEAATTPLIELWVEFTLTLQQVEREEDLGAGETLATRAANLLSQAEDVLIFQGDAAIAPNSPTRHPLFAQGRVRTRSGPVGIGLLDAAPARDPQNPQPTDRQTIDVRPLPPVPDRPGTRWGENTFESVADGYSRLQRGEGLDQAHYGPYALVFRTEPYADTYAPVLTNQAAVANTLAITADRIKPLVTAGYYGTGTLPEFTGILVSLGGNTVDLVVGLDPITAFMQEDTQGRYRLRVVERWALRIKDRTAVIRLEFQEGE